MTYRLLCKDASVREALVRIATEQIDKTIDEVRDGSMTVHERVHRVRKRCKKLRGAIRLVRPAFDDYDKENAAFRDAAADLSSIRDSAALIETYDELVGTYEDQVQRAAFASVRRRLTMRKKEIAEGGDIDNKLAILGEGMRAARKRALAWRLRADGIEAVQGGLKKTYKRARKAMVSAEKNPTTEAFHEWRKRAKYHWYHARLLRPIWPCPMNAHGDAADKLTDLLGARHDLAVFRSTLANEPGAFGSSADLEVLSGLIAHRASTLEKEAFLLGGRLFAERPSALARRWRVYWQVWRGKRSSLQNAFAA